ncbi:MAG: TonB-dependent receptor [Gemmatimonadota bacterium]|uniref:TonB-dependent receptor n=1 Tax=Candidatus Palauibacter scopulicola TaxID=3056741 RepID=UPI00238707AB|nr:TonB-dependent receptor [Candidatus Palauibacter scopulicola]MDE2664239.1 TonB-dependent receptor [Candidatus Palauibacter scopulicola]
MAAAGAGGAAAQEAEPVRLSGYVRVAENDEVIRAARLDIEERGLIIGTNRFGFYSVELPPGRYSIRVTSLGYETVTEVVDLRETTSLDFSLPLRPVIVTELTVTADREPPDLDPASLDMSVVRLDVPSLSELPLVLGEADPVRTLTLYPGISTANDATTAINVRGGAGDENQIRLDDSEVFNPAHAIGLFSTFNSDAVGDVTLYKGGIPARYGGRLSSVLEIHQREGNSREFEGAATIGLLSSRLSLQGPLFDGRGSWLVAGRRTYADLFLGLSSDPSIQESAAYFYDLNAKANARYGATGQVMLSGYFGRDRLRIGTQASAGWGNATGTLRWNHVFGPVFSHLTVTYSDYEYHLQNNFNAQAASLDAGIRNFSVTIDESWDVGPSDRLEFGLGLRSYEIQPANIAPGEGSAVIATEFESRRGLSPEAYIEHETEIGRLGLRYGLRAAGFIRRGAATVYDYENGAPVVYRPALGRYEPGAVVDSTRYGDGETIISYGGLEPRLGLRFGLSDASSLKASYSRTRQYLRLVTNTNSPTPLDLWDPVGPYVKPHVADQFALGYVSTLAGGRYALSGEVYYKRARHLIDYVDGADIYFSRRLETLLLPGDGRGYGVEFLLRKTRGRLTGWASYTLARSDQRTPGLTAADPGVNGGDWYPSPYDRTHDFALTGLYRLGEDWSLGANFVFATGLPTTYPVARYEFAGLILGEFGPRNARRLPAYHRLDVSATRRWGRGELQFGLFNVYNRFNAQAIAFRQNRDSRTVTEAVETAVFGLVPSISYRRNF